MTKDQLALAILLGVVLFMWAVIFGLCAAVVLL